MIQSLRENVRHEFNGSADLLQITDSDNSIEFLFPKSSQRTKKGQTSQSSTVKFPL